MERFKISPVKNNRALLLGLLIVSAMLLSSLFPGLFAAHAPDEQVSPATTRFLPPSSQHWFGTDQFGRDVFSRVLYGGRISLVVAGAVVLLATFLGTGYGLVSGYLGGWFDHLLMRVLDVFLSFPVLFIAVVAMALFSSGLGWLILVLSLTSWMDIARLVRAEVLSLKSRPFILRTRLAGLPPLSVMAHHIVPNLLATVSTVAILRAADIILIESSLSFLGLGVQPPTASWGAIIADGRAAMAFAWWLIAFPAIAIILTILGFHLAGEGLKSAYGR